MFKRNFFKFSAFIFFILSLVSFFYSNKPLPKQNYEKKQIVQKVTTLPAASPTIPIIKSSLAAIPTSIVTSPTDAPNTPAPQPTTIPTPRPTDIPQDLKVSLTIAGSSVGTVDMSQGANQCDVLNRALSEGKIQSLNMRYDNTMGTNAVYQINGVGKENSVWWAFKVNSTSPSQGCSYIKVKSGDSAEWDYLGN